MHNILERVHNERIVEVVARCGRVPLHCNSLADAQLCHWAKVPISVSPLFMDSHQHAETQNEEVENLSEEQHAPLSKIKGVR